MLFAIFESISNLDFLFTCKSISVAYLSAVNFFIPFISFINISSFSSDFIRLYTQLSHLKPSSFPVTSLNRSIMAVKFSFLLTTSSILAISSKIAKNACIAIAKV